MKNKMYLILYYISFIVTVLFLGFAIYKSNGLLSYSDGSLSDLLSISLLSVLGIINILLVIIFTVLNLKKNKINPQNILYPIFYLCFFTIIVIMCFLFNNKVMVRYIHFDYYSVFICIGYLFLNIYTLLLIKNKK